MTHTYLWVHEFKNGYKKLYESDVDRGNEGEWSVTTDVIMWDRQEYHTFDSEDDLIIFLDKSYTKYIESLDRSMFTALFSGMSKRNAMVKFIKLLWGK